MIEIIGAITTVLSVAGVVLINRHKIECFYLWMVSNTMSAGIHWQTATWSLMVRDIIFLILAVEGIWLWRKKQKIDAEKIKSEFFKFPPDRRICQNCIYCERRPIYWDQGVLVTKFGVLFFCRKNTPGRPVYPNETCEDIFPRSPLHYLYKED